MHQVITLPNGVRVACEAVPSVRSAAVGIWVGAGSRCEKRGEEGSAHYIEHMLFKGTAGSSAARLAGRMDAIGGLINAFTTRDSTCFYARVMDSHLDQAVDILCEMFFESLFREADVANERGVILEEIDMFRDTPEDLVVENLMAKVFPGPLGKPVLGRPASLKAMTGDSLRSFMDREYTPDRIVVSLCGRFADADIQRLADRFSVLPRRTSRPWKTTVYAPASVFKRKATEQDHFCLAWPGLPDGSEERFAMQIMTTVLGGGMSSRLFQTVREENGLCYAIGSFTAAYRETGMFAVSTAVSRESEKKALSLIRQEISRFLQDGITPEELDRTREQVKSAVALSLESTSYRMNRLGSSLLQLGYCLTADQIIERYNAVTAEEVLSLAQRTLLPDKMSFSALGRIPGAEELLNAI